MSLSKPVVAYKFSGDKLRRVWSRQELPQGRLEAVGNKLTLTYLTRLVPPWEERTDIYAVGPSGVKLEATRRKPNP